MELGGSGHDGCNLISPPPTSYEVALCVVPSLESDDSPFLLGVNEIVRISEQYV
ncbi:hypothetical protein DPMN_186292 [Dreissena polymorpha]|uniref:Uncharacterized protein n=1 Tax=Dreissena polymorpha TaxID=45954 RepID=A0A9D4DME8_DREPO|nr:hypothetical protein DPMN_186292 [Dreissena polymorpha]